MAGPFEMYRKIQELAAMCTASATPGSKDSLISSVCYDSAGCCDESAAKTVSMTDGGVSYKECISSAASPEDMLACTDNQPASG